MTVRLISQGMRRYIYITGCVTVLSVSQALAGIQITTAEEVLQNTGNILQQSMPNMDFLFVNRQVSTTTASRVDDDSDDDYTSDDSSYRDYASNDQSSSNNDNWGGSDNDDWGGSDNDDSEYDTSDNRGSDDLDYDHSQNWGSADDDYGWNVQGK